MQIKTSHMVDLVTTLQLIHKMNASMSPVFRGALDLNLARMMPEYNTYQGWDEATRKAFEEVELQINIQQVSLNDLPERVPNYLERSVLEVLSPILSDYKPENTEGRKSKLQQLAKAKETEAEKALQEEE